MATARKKRAKPPSRRFRRPDAGVGASCITGPSNIPPASERAKEKFCGYNSSDVRPALRLRDGKEARAPRQRPRPLVPRVGRIRNPRALLPARGRGARPLVRPDRARVRRPPWLHPSVEHAVQSFRLLPPDTTADPALLAHLAREGLAARDGGFKYRFDPACYGSRKPVDTWPLLPRIIAPTLVVRGEHSPVLPRDMAERTLGAVPRASLLEIPGAYHH